MEASSIAWDFPSFLWQNLDAIGFLSAPWSYLAWRLRDLFRRIVQNQQLDEVLSILVFTGLPSCSDSVVWRSVAGELHALRLLECFQQRSQAKENSQLDESQLPLISLSSLTLGFLL